MARVFDDSTANFLQTASAPLTSYPCTFALWIWPNTSTSDGMPIAITSTNSNNDGFWVYQNPSDKIVCNTADDGVQSTASASSASVNIDAWNHIAGTYTTSPSHQGWLNGVANPERTDTKTTFTAVPNNLTVGIKGRTPPGGNPYDGNLAWPCVWDVKLTDAEIVTLSKGAHPYSVRPESIINFWGDIHGTGDEPPTIGSLTLTENGTVAAAESPLTTFGSVGMVTVNTGAAGGTAPLFLYHNRHHNLAA